MSQKWVNLHRHSHFSSFDGFGTAQQAAQYAASLGQTALGLADHGTVSGLVEHYTECLAVGIKPILGVEAYFQPVFDKDKPRYHLPMWAVTQEGYHNIMRLTTLANTHNFHRYPIMDLEMLSQHTDGIVCTSGCLAGMIPRLLMHGDYDTARKVAKKFNKLFPGRFYLEVQPYSVMDKVDQKDEDAPIVDLQRIVNDGSIKLSEELNIPVLLTSDSHYTAKHHYDTYLVMHQIAGRGGSADYTYRYMPEADEVLDAWQQMMGTDGTEYALNSVRIADSADVSLDFPEIIPTVDWGMPSDEKLRKLAIEGLKAKGKTSKRYGDRLRHEIEVIVGKGFQDYFLLCWDIIEYAKRNDIGYGFGRGSVAGSLLAYAIGITEVDPIILNTHFERFLRPDKNTLPDIDMDFDSRRRGEVIAYLLNRYAGRAAPIANFGYYKTKNLANDLAKLFEVDAAELDRVKTILENVMRDGLTDDELRKKSKELVKFDLRYPDFLKHFTRLYGQVRFMGKHAAGVAIADKDLDKYVALMKRSGDLVTSYNLDALKQINVLKVDVLGLDTVSTIREVEALTGACFTYDTLDDPDVYAAFAAGDTDGIFQFERGGAKAILQRIQPESIQDLVAATSINRPGASIESIQDFLDGKNGNIRQTPWLDYTSDAYGAIIYQEHAMQICREIAGLDWETTDKIMKTSDPTYDGNAKYYRDKFMDGIGDKLPKHEAEELFIALSQYLFNKGHGVAYTLMSYYEMYLRIKYPLEFWYALLRNEHVDRKRDLYKSHAVHQGVVILLPHVNGTADYSIATLDGERCIQEGLKVIRSLGALTAREIENNGPYTDKDDFLSKVPKRHANTRVVKALEDWGALEFDHETYVRRLKRYNTSLYARKK